MTKRRVLFSLLAGMTLVANCIVSSVTYADGGVEARLPEKVDGAGGAQGSRAGRHPVSLGDASQEQTSEAVAHFARARALVIAAIHEFDKGRKIASPNNLLDSVKWRNTLIDRAEDLDRVLDPQPRATKGGIRFEADPRLLPEATK